MRQAACPEFPTLTDDDDTVHPGLLDRIGIDEGAHRPVLPNVPPVPVGATALAIGTAPGVRCIAYDIRLREQPPRRRGPHRRAGRARDRAARGQGRRRAHARRALGPAERALREPRRRPGRRLLHGARDVLEVCLDVVPDPVDEEQRVGGEPFDRQGDPDADPRARPGARPRRPTRTHSPGRACSPARTSTRRPSTTSPTLMNAAAADAEQPRRCGRARSRARSPTTRSSSCAPGRTRSRCSSIRRGGGCSGSASSTARAISRPATAYDYRITGRFRRRDVEERLHGFHAVPRGTTLPTAFALGPSRCSRRRRPP